MHRSDILIDVMEIAAPVSKSFLVPLSGPPVEAIELLAKPGGLVVGRHDQCDVRLPADAEKVSRFHARFDHDGSRWRVTDLNSRWGTFVNGIKLSPQTDVPLKEGDLIRITPWTFSVSPSAKRRGFVPADDSGHTMIRTVAPDPTRPMADAMLALLLESASAIHSAIDERNLAELVIDAAIRGTGFQNAALLRPVDGQGHLQIISSRFGPHVHESGVTFSRSLITAASQGVVAEVNTAGTPPADISQSIVQLRINSAICVPLMLGSTVAAYLYLDSRGTLLHQLRPGASAFCVALGRMASLALANLKRMEMETREALMRAELSAAAVAQKWIMPKRNGRFGPFSTIGESKPGQYVGGDFFDIIPLSDHRLAVAVGDVSGKGVSASVLMTATQGYLHAALTDSGDPGAAVTDVNRFVNPRRPESKFVTAWVGVFDADKRELCYVDAGHSYALLRRADGSIEQLNQGGGLPIGVEESFDFHVETVRIEPGDRVLVVSDGIVEQFGMVTKPDGTVAREQFQVQGMQDALTRVPPAGQDEVANLFASVIRHAGTDQLSDDATVVLVRWDPGQ